MKKSWFAIVSFIVLALSALGQNDSLPIKIGYKNQDTTKAPKLSIDQALQSQDSFHEGTDIVIRGRVTPIAIDPIPIYPHWRDDDATFQAGENSETISLNKQPISYNNLGDLLSHQANITIKNYGTEGMASSVSLRGAGSSRTQLLWEGIPLNSISAGDNNLSIIPVNGFNTIEINRTASATTNGSGTFGGSISCNSNPDWSAWDNYGKKKIVANADANLSYGSFNTFKSNVHYNVTALRKKINYQGSFFYTKSDGDFDYYDYIRLENLKRQNADFQKYGTIQTLHFRHNKLTSQVSLWYQVNDANLPALLGTTSSNVEHQIDSSLRCLLKMKYRFNYKNYITYTTAYINDYELYTQKITPTAETYSTYSEIQNQTNTHILNYTHELNDNFHFQTEIQGKWAKADIDNYAEPKTEYSTAGIVKLAYNKKFAQKVISQHDKINMRYNYYKVYVKEFSSTLSVRKELNSQYTIPFIVNWGSELSFSKAATTLRFNIGNKYRTPTFNDLYWTGWGNPDLKPESGWTTELGADKVFLYKHDDRNKLIVDVSTYYSVINDMIMWSPSGSVWHPYNTAQAVLQGIEFSFLGRNIFETKCKIKYKITDTVAQPNNTVTRRLTLEMNNKLTANINNPHISKTYDQTGATESVGHILYYVPKYEIHYELHVNSELFREFFILGEKQKQKIQLKSLLDNCDLLLYVNYESMRYYNLTKTLDDFVTIDASLQKTFYFHPYKDSRHDNMKITLGFHVRNLTNTIYEQVRSYPLPGRNFEISLRGTI